MNEAMTKPRATLCAYDQCRTLCLGELFYYRHRLPDPTGTWALAEQVRDELEQHDKHNPKDPA